MWTSAEAYGSLQLNEGSGQEVCMDSPFAGLKIIVCNGLDNLPWKSIPYMDGGA